MFGLFSKDKSERIGVFQLENLTMSQANFMFFILGDTISPQIEPYASRGKHLPEAEILEMLKDHPNAEGTPVVLHSEPVRHAEKLAARLAKMGFINCYIVDLNFENT